MRTHNEGELAAFQHALAARVRDVRPATAEELGERHSFKTDQEAAELRQRVAEHVEGMLPRTLQQLAQAMSYAPPAPLKLSDKGAMLLSHLGYLSLPVTDPAKILGELTELEWESQGERASAGSERQP